MSESVPDAMPIPSAIAELVANSEARRWAHDCGWLPGTGHCDNRGCSASCLFRAQRDGESERLIRERAVRRPAQRQFFNRLSRFLPLLLSLPQLLALA